MWETVCETVTMPVGMTSESKRFFRSAVSMPSEHIEQVSSSDLGLCCASSWQGFITSD